MTDAFAAEAAATRGSLERPRAYIFVSFAGRTPPPPDDWRGRGLEPIFYNQAYRHSRLRKTLLAWAGYREDWLSSKQQIIRRFAPVDPRIMSPSDTSNFIWAVRGQKDDEGFGARSLASLGKDTRIEWLSVLHSDEQQRSEHYSGARESGQEEASRPFLPLSSLTCGSFSDHYLTPTSIALAAWLTSHLDRAETIDWVLRRMQSGAILHPTFRHIIRRALQKEPKLPPSFALFWQIVSVEASWVVMQRNEDHFWHLYGQLAEVFESSLIRMEFLDILRPRLKLRPPIWGRYLEGMLGGSGSTGDSRKG